MKLTSREKARKYIKIALCIHCLVLVGAYSWGFVTKEFLHKGDYGWLVTGGVIQIAYFPILPILELLEDIGINFISLSGFAILLVAGGLLYVFTGLVLAKLLNIFVQKDRQL